LIEVLQKDYRTDFLLNSNIFEPELVGALNLGQKKVAGKADKEPKRLKNLGNNGIINPDLLKNIVSIP
jgi:hypothetical protein